jgi:hypothetical protein
MPNTLAHIGLQAPLTRLGIKKAPLQWIALGCIIPDIPWIVQRILLLIPGINRVSLNLYATTQASLVFCLVLSMALAMLSSNCRKIFLILATNSLLHLLLDASQTKWGNGANFWVPFSWQTTNFAMFWPEHFSTYLFTAMGAVALFIYWPKATHTSPFLKRPNTARTACLSCCLILYCLSPILFLNAAYEANTHSSKTLTGPEPRTGKLLELDRARYSTTKQSLRCYSGEELSIANPPPNASSFLSIRAQFLNEKTLQLTEYHYHRINRDYASYTGLLLTLLLWTHTLFFQRTCKNSHRSSQ